MNALLNVLPVILSLIIMEGLLSIQNAMILAAMVAHLPEREQRWALKAGIAGAYVLRGLALLLASVLISSYWVRIAGAVYLFYVMCKNVGRQKPVEKRKISTGRLSFWMTLVSVQLVDLAFSIDNVVAAAAMSKSLWMIVTGVFIGMAMMRFMSGFFIKLMQKHPILETIAYLLVGCVGIQFFIAQIWHHELHALFRFLLMTKVIGYALVYNHYQFLQRWFGPLLGWLHRRAGDIAWLFEQPFRPFKAVFNLLKRHFSSWKS